MDKTATDFFNFAGEPFKRTPDVNAYFMSGQCREALQTLNSLLQSDENFATLTGPVGTGKSVTLLRFIQDLPDDTIFAYILFPNLRPKELLHALLENFGITDKEQPFKGSLTERFEDFIKTAEKSGKHVVLVIDEIQKLPEDTLKEFFILSSDNPGLKFILAGRPEQPTEKITSLNATLNNLTQEETIEYIKYRAEKAGRKNALTSRNAARLVWNYTKGNPGLVNTLMERAIISARLDGARVIKVRHIHSAAKSLNPATSAVPTGITKRRIIFSAAAALLAATLAFGGYKLYTAQQQPIVTASAERTQPSVPPVSVTPPATAIQPAAPTPPTADTQDITDEPLPAPEPETSQPPTSELPPAVPPQPPAPPQPTEPAAPEQTLSETDFGIGNDAVVAVPVLNIRILPLLDAERIGTLNEGQRITVQEESAYWVRITLPGGRDGWVYKQYLSKPVIF